jgi:hypothetical protein
MLAAPSAGARSKGMGGNLDKFLVSKLADKAVAGDGNKKKGGKRSGCETGPADLGILHEISGTSGIATDGGDLVRATLLGLSVSLVTNGME